MEEQAARPKRQKTSSNKMKAFERLKQVKSGGGMNKYEVTPMENVYEEVTEDEYTETVLKRQHDDWIVGDFGAEGYVEDGREIFDDDLDEESIQRNRKSKKRDHSGIPKNVEPPKGNIQKMLANMPAKKKKAVNLEKDDVLGDLMGELDDTFGSHSPIRTPSSSGLPKYSSNAYSNSSNHVPRKILEPINEIKPTSSRVEVKHKVETKVVEDATAFPDLEEWEMPFDVSSNSEQPKVETKSPLETVAKDEPKASNEAVCADFDEWDVPFDVPNDVGMPKSSSVPTNPVQSKFAEELACSGWETMSSSTNESAPAVNTDYSKLPLIEKEDGKKVFKFFYWDAYEDVFHKPGTIFLFGKVCVDGSNYASCCVTVKNVERRMYFLPREKKYDMTKKQFTDEPVTPKDLYNEFNQEIAEKYRITEFKSNMECKKYAFSVEDVPDSCEYLQVRYRAEFPALPSNLVGKTFSHVFGTSTPPLELFLIERRIKGPCWLEIVDPLPSSPPVSWCKLEVTCENMANVTPVNDGTPPPPLVVLALNMRITPIPPKSHENQITMISCLVHNNYRTDKEAPSQPFENHFCAFTKPIDVPWPFDCKEALDNCRATKLDKMNSERALLGLFLAKFHKIDPDLIVGHDIYGFDIGTLVHRIGVNKIPHWSRLGRLRRANAPNLGKGRNFIERNIMCGRLLCDITISAKELIKARSYDLDTLCQQVLQTVEGERRNLTSEEVKTMFKTSASLINLIKLTMQDAAFILRIMYKLNVMPLSLQITNIAGNVLSRTLMGGRAERNEYLLLHAFHEKNYIVPDKTFGKKGKTNSTDAPDEMANVNVGKGKRKPQYEGGLVLEPKKGFYDKLILLMDFNSLYPSIIQEFNICFTTIPIRAMKFDEDDLMTLMNNLPNVSEKGILPTEIRKLVQSRRAVKALMKDPDITPDLRHQYDIRQLALKLTANSMYGCLGFPNSRFYAKPLAAMVTAKGREILVNTRDLVQKLNFDVIYGDTDSLMINSNSVDFDEVFKIGHKIKVEVNKLYKQIELDIDGVFKYMLLLKKKKYAAVTLSKVNGKLISKQEIKGLDIVRRDWSPLSANAGKFVLNQLLCDQPLEDKLANIHSKLSLIKKNLDENNIPIGELAITKQLTKNPEDYPDKKSLPHVQVALRMNQNLAKKFKQGDSIFYVVCEDGTTNAATQRAYHVEEFKIRDDLKIDVKYYLSQQVHPVVTRLCEPIDGIDAVQIAESLGLDTSSYIKRMDTISEENDEIAIEEAEKFKNCDKFEFRCPDEKCSTINMIDSPVVKNDDGNVFPSFSCCSNPNCEINPIASINYFQNKLTIMMRSYVHKYYLDWMVCEEPTCAYRTRVITRLTKNFDPLCPSCSNKNILVREYTESQLYNQLCFFQHLFDITHIISKYKLRFEHNSVVHTNYCRLKAQVDEFLQHSAYNIIDLGKICRQMLIK